MSTRALRRSLLIGSLLAVGIMTSRQTYAQSGETVTNPPAPTGFGTLVIEQISEGDIMGEWTLLGPNNVKFVSTEKVKDFGSLPAGSYTLIVSPPEGSIGSLRLWNKSAEVRSLDRIQMTFAMANGDVLKMAVHYTFTLVGNVSVVSDPNGLGFTLTGPNAMTQTGKTPMSYEDVPEGHYKVQYETLPGCITPPPKALSLEKGKRISFDIKLVCKAADDMRAAEQKLLDRVENAKTNTGVAMSFRDIDASKWYAADVLKAAARGILTGYKDEMGAFTGEYGPGNNVTAAELAAIAHRVANLPQIARAEGPYNPWAYGQWFSSVISSAEERGWGIYLDGTIDPLRPVTRGEVLDTLLHATNEALQWQTGKVFTDVTLRTPYAASIETAAKLGIVEGRKKEGQPTGTFGPMDPVNRAEMAKIVNAVMDKLGKNDTKET
jgi:hypothetical protein